MISNTFIFAGAIYYVSSLCGWIFLIGRMLKTFGRKEAFMNAGLWSLLIGGIFTTAYLVLPRDVEMITAPVEVFWLILFGLASQLMHAFNLRKVCAS